MHMIEELAKQLGKGDPVVARIVSNARLFPEGRDSVFALLQAKARQMGYDPGRQAVFGIPAGLGQEGVKLGDVLVGEAVHGDFRFSREMLPGNVGLFGATGTGKSFLARRMAEWFIGQGICVIILDVSGEHCSLVRRFGPDRLLVIGARHFPMGVFVNPPGSRLSPLAWLASVVSALGEVFFLRDGTRNLLLKVIGGMYRERGVLDGSGEYPTAAEAFVKLQTEKFSAQSRHAGFLETALNRLHGLLQSFPGMNTRHSVSPEEVCRRSLIIRMADLSPEEIEQFSTLFLAWLMSYREGIL
jgi:hypothetical protein